MRTASLLLIVLLCFSSCKSSKSAKVVTKKEPISHSNTKVDKIVGNALKYEGTRYKYGGTTKRGMDCSGLVMVAFNEEGIAVPRTTADLSKYGDWVDIKKLQKGDLVFFATRKNSRKVNHVGIVTSTKNNEIKFVHASTSKGVITSSLDERYWFYAYVQARRVL